MISPSSSIVFSSGIPCTTTSFTDVQILAGNGAPYGLGTPLNVGTALLSLINSSAILFSPAVETPGFICFANSPSVLPTSWLALYINSISSSVFRNICITKKINKKKHRLIFHVHDLNLTGHRNGASTTDFQSAGECL